MKGFGSSGNTILNSLSGCQRRFGPPDASPRVFADLKHLPTGVVVELLDRPVISRRLGVLSDSPMEAIVAVLGQEGKELNIVIL